MKFQLPASDYPIIRVLILSCDNLVRMDFCGEQPQEVDVDVPAGAKVGYVSVAGSGEEIGDPVLLHAEPKPLAKPEPPVKPEPVVEREPAKPEPVAEPVAEPAEKPVIALAYAAEQPAAEAPPETVKVEEKTTVKVGRKK
jgi:hypothetical protein